ncbi:MAG TPA: TIGR04338 family metallohydrolase [Mycolicibacterium fallax]|nr:TIGR04338 family metallohydrolase [Mycolicibacterium fallax]
MTDRDVQRAKVYAAEAFVRAIFDTAAQQDSRVVEFFGTELTLPPEAKFSSVQSVRRYVDQVLALPAVAERWPVSPVAVRARRGLTAASYERAGAVPTIAVPERETRWALRELVVLHEIAHHLCPDAKHGPAFTGTLCDLAAAVMGPEAGYLLRVVYAKDGVAVD